MPFHPSRPRALLLALAASLALAACDNSEERAEKHFQSAVALMEEGDVERALVELRNVFRLNGQHLEARLLYAGAVRDRGETAEAFGQYLRVVEQAPGNLDARLAVAEIAIATNNWDAARQHVERLGEMAPDDPRARANGLAVAYHEAVTGNEPDTRRAVARDAAALLETAPDYPILHTIVVDSLMLDGEYVAALERLDAALEVAPEDISFYRMRLSALARLDDAAEIEATLKEMIARFPEDAELPNALIRFYGTRGDIEGAETFLRGRIVADAPDDAARLSLVRFLQEARGTEAALQAAQDFVAEGTNDTLFRSLAASLKFDTGQRREAIAEMEEILVDAPEGEQTDRLKVALARMLEVTGNRVGARALVEEVLAVDGGMVEALQMKASWLIDEDETDEAIILLRTALNQKPDDLNVLQTMAQAHLRNGDRDLAGEVLSLAVQASDVAVPQALAYAEFLVGEERYGPAEAVLLEGMRRSPSNLRLMSALGRVYLATEDWGRLEQLERTLRGVQTPEATAVANELRVAMLRAQRRPEDAIAVLQGLAAEAEGLTAADVAIIETHLSEGDPEAARNHVDSLLEQDTGSPALRFLSALIATETGDYATAEAGYRALIEDGVQGERVWLELMRALALSGRLEEVPPTLEAALQANPQAPNLLWSRASLLEREGDTEGAIAIYERLYELDRTSNIVANNLASLLSTTRDDEESLERAYTLARRLRDIPFAPFQDTYGWIAYRRGELEIALEHLIPAAGGLPEDPMVQYHAARALEADGQLRRARDLYQRALDLAGGDPRPAFDTARERLASIRTALELGSNGLDSLSE